MSESTSDKVFNAISADIFSGLLTPGSKVTEADIAKRFGINRAPLREALLRLEERKLIERVPYSGTRVAKLSPEAQSDLFEVREVLEGLAARKAASVITDAELQELREILDQSMERVRLMKDGGDARDLPAIRGFHPRIAEIAGNLELQRMLNSEIWQFARSNYQRLMRTHEGLMTAATEHERIFEALADRDAELAEMLMRRHIARARERMVKSNRQEKP